MKKIWKTILWIAVPLVLILIIVSALGGDDGMKQVNVEKSAMRSITENVSASGKIQPETEVKIQSQVSGEIVELPVKEGDLVKQGQVLVRINPDIYESSLNRAQASINSAKSNLSSAKARRAQAEAQFKATELNYARQKKLFDDGAISKAEMETITSTYETSKAELVASNESISSAEFSIESAQAGVTEASDNLKRTTILAPMNGTVTALTKELGEAVLGNSMMSGDIIMKISALQTMEVNVEVNESDIVRVQLGDTTLVEVDAYDDEKFKGVVTEISNTASNMLTASIDQVTNFEVKIRILPESYAHLAKDQATDYSPFRPGMSATVEIQTEKAENVLTVPIKAVATREDTSSASILERIRKKENATTETVIPEEPFTVVFVMNETTKVSELRVVETGIQDDKFIHILSGVNEGEQVITGPYDEVSRKLKPGDQVEIKRIEDATDAKEEEEEEE
ncbi:MAG: efflux RND transporter periplasmic adaptor subunit [Flavobacteriales bacterium]